MTKRVEEKQEVVKHVVGITCDKCGADIPLISEGEGGVYVDFALESFTVSQTDSNYTVVNGWSVDDLCTTCMAELHDLLLDNGFNVRTYK